MKILVNPCIRKVDRIRMRVCSEAVGGREGMQSASSEEQLS